MIPEEQVQEIIANDTRPRRKSVPVNMVFGFMSFVLPGLAAFFSTPIVVKALGSNDYGIYALIFGFISYSVSFSIGKGVTKYVAEYMPARDYKKINDVISATLVLCLILGLGAALFFAGAADWLVKSAVQIAPEDQAKSIQSFYLAAAVIFFYTLSQVFSGVITGLHRFDIYSYVSTFYGVFLAGGNIALALMGYSLIELFWWCLLTNAVVCLVYYICAKRLLPEMRITPRFSGSMFGIVVKFSAGVIFGQIFANLLLLFERGLITRELGSQQLTYYVVPMTIGIYIHMFIASFIMVLFPKASELGSQTGKQIVMYERITKIVVTVVGFIAVTLMASSHLFLQKWVGVEIADNAWAILIVQTLIFSLMAIGGISWQLSEGLGHTNYNALLTFIWMVVGAALMLVFINYWGGLGVGLARLAGVLSIPFSILYVERWLLGKARWGFWLKLLLVLAAALLLTAIAEVLIFRNLPVSWITLFAGGAAGAGVYAIVLFLSGWFTQDEKELFGRVFGRFRAA